MKQTQLSKLFIPIFTFVVGVTTATALIAHSLRSAPPSPPPELPPEPPEVSMNSKPSLEMVFVLDTTGSMGGLLEGAKQKIWSIVNEVMQSPSRPAVRVGLVAYRDRGDEYVTRVLPLSNDLDQVYSTLMNYSAAGGGDTPEDVRRALSDGVHKAGWSQPSSSIAQILFLVGDAPPHEDYQNEPSTEVSVAEASRAGIIVNTIQCGNLSETTPVWQAIAGRGQGQYFAIAQNGGVQAISTPYDKEIGELGAKLGSTYMAYGGGAGEAGERHRAETKARQVEAEVKVVADAAPSAAADRAVNKVVNADAYIGDMLQSIENGSLKLDSVKDEDLPGDLRKLSANERKTEIARRLAERAKLRADIMALSKQRDEFISGERKKQVAAGGKESGFDVAVSRALKTQVEKKGIK
ncbi:MAG TPA: vWA domain-containing protein [Blastocatellia bacterium]|jgi:Mg-chelatase subunit ChlD|nr:vWA domain-containing protein [Blastocatellia bacterium]